MLRARVRVAKPGASFELLREGVVLAEREFESLPRRCDERVQALAIALVLAFESVQAREREAVSVAPTPAPAPQASTAPPAEAEAQSEATPAANERSEAEETAPQQSQEEPRAASEAAPEPAREAVASWLALHAGGGVLLGALPEPAWLLTLGAGIALTTALELELSVLASPGVSHALADGFVDAELYGGQGALCWSTPFGGLRAAGCAGFAAAAVPARGRDFAVRDRSVLTGWAAALLAGALELPLAGPVSARVYAGFYGSLVRPALAAKVDGARPDATPFPIGGVLLLQVLWALP